jgi:AcrR family transcriptional regulator
LTWGFRPARTRGPTPSLSVEDIASEAVAIADRDGLGSVTMERVARSVGCTKMALYRYVQSKSDLVAVMFDAAVGQPPAAVGRIRSWRRALRTWATALLDRYQAHPWAMEVPLGTAALTRNQARWLEAALATMADLPISPQDKLEVVLLLNAHAMFRAKIAGDVSAGNAPAPDPELGEAIAAQLPYVSDVWTAGYLSDGDATTGFERGLDYLLAGIEAMLPLPRSDGRPRAAE